MGIFNFKDASPFLDVDYNAPPKSRIYIYFSGTEQLSPVYQDSALTILQANPVITSDSGAIPSFYLIEGNYHFVVRNQNDDFLFEETDVDVLPTDTNLASRRFEKVSDILADKTLSYLGGFGREKVQIGDIVHVDQGTFSYEILTPSTASATLVTGGGVKLGQLGKWNPRALGDFSDPARTHDTPEFQEAITESLITGRKFEWDGGTARIDGPLSVVYANTIGLSKGQSAVIDLSDCRIEHVGTDYVFHMSEEGNNAARPKVKFQSPFIIGNPDSKGAFYLNCWGDMTIQDAVFMNFPAGSQCIWLHNDFAGDYTENFHIYNAKTVSNRGTFLKCSQGIGTASFSRLTVRDIFIAGSHEKVFDLSGGVYDSLFENIKGNPGGSTIFKMQGAMGGSQIRKVNIEQTAASGRCFDVSGGFTGNPPTIDFTSFSYVGEGTRWEFGETGLTDSDFGALRGANVEAYGTVSAGRGLFDAGIALPVHDIQVQVNLHATDSTNLVYATDKYGAQIPGFNGMVCGQLVWEIGANQHCGIAPFIKAAGGGGGLGLDVAKGLSLGTAVPILARDSNGFLQIKTSTGGYEGLTFKGHLRVKL